MIEETLQIAQEGDGDPALVAALRDCLDQPYHRGLRAIVWRLGQGQPRRQYATDLESRLRQALQERDEIWRQLHELSQHLANVQMERDRYWNELQTIFATPAFRADRKFGPFKTAVPRLDDAARLPGNDPPDSERG